MLTFFYGTTGTGKSYAMMNKIKSEAEAGRKICVTVPDQFTFEYEHMLYNHLGCRLFNNGRIKIFSFSRLTADIFRHTHIPSGAPADQTAKTAVMYRAVRETADKDGLSFFAKQASRPSFVNTALTMLSELIHSGVTPEILGRLINTAPENMRDKLTDIFLIYSRYASELERLGLRDSLCDTGIAAEFAEAAGLFDGMSLFMDEFKSFTGDQLKMIKAMLCGCKELTICMTADELYSDAHGPFTAVNDTCRRLASIAKECGSECRGIKFSENKRYRSEAVFSLSENLLRQPSDVFNGDTDAVTIVKAGDIYGECAFICSEICRLISENDKLRYSDIAVLSRSMNDDISVLETHFQRYEIPYYSDRKLTAGHKPLMLMVTSALELAAEKKISTETLLRYAKTGLTEAAPEEISELENYCYTWDIDGNMWQSTFPDEKIDDIKNRLLAPLKKLRSKCAGKSGGEICNALRSFIAETGAEKKLMSFQGKYITEAETAEEIRENTRLCQKLDEILSSMETALDGSCVSLSQFREIFMLSAAKITLASPPDALDSVAAQQSDLARLSNPKIVFVMSANDGNFPFVTGESVTFSERERDFFAKAGCDLSGSMKKRLAEERFNAFKAVCSPSERLYVSYSETDSSGNTLYPSSFIEKISRCIPGRREIDANELELLFFCRTEQSAYAAAAEGYDAGDSQYVTVKRELEKNPVYRGRFKYIESVDTSFNHKVSDRRLMKRLYGRTLEVSASRFEDYSKCPFMYYCKTGLRLYPLSKMNLSPVNQGNMMHSCLKDIFSSFGKEEFIKLSPERLRELIGRSSDDYIRKEMSGGFAKKKSFEFYLDIMTDTLLMVLIHMQEEIAASSFVPSDFELPVGVKAGSASASVTPVVITCGDGNSLNFTGTADRVDVFKDEDGTEYIRIIDYKTGAKDFCPEQLALGINMQMFFYLFALTDEAGGKYCGFVPAGALYIPVKYPKSSDDRLADMQSASECIDRSLKMQGTVLDNSRIINAMEKNCEGRFIPVSYTKSGNLSASSSVMDSRMLEKVKEYAIKLLKDMCSGVYAGSFPASPLESTKYKCQLPCTYCDYREICGNFPDTRVKDISGIAADMFKQSE